MSNVKSQDNGSNLQMCFIVLAILSDIFSHF